jgi:hypothetical protein
MKNKRKLSPRERALIEQLGRAQVRSDRVREQAEPTQARLGLPGSADQRWIEQYWQLVDP